MRHPSSAQLNSQQAHLLGFFRLAILLEPPFGLTYLVSALLLRRRDLALMAGVLTAAWLLILLARRLTLKGRVKASALTTGYTVLGTATLLVLILPQLYAACIPLCLLGVACVLPQAREWALKLYLSATTATLLLVMLVATLGPPAAPLPETFQNGLLIASVTAPGALICVLLWQYSTERKAAEDALRFLSHAGSLLASSLDFDATLQRVGQLAIPRLSDWCLLDLLDESGRWQLVALIHADSSAEATARALLLQQGGAGAPGATAPAGLESRSVILHGQDPPPGMEPRRVALLQALGPGSLLQDPLVAQGRPSGVLTLGRTSHSRPFTAQDAILAEELARRVATAVENARLFQQSQSAIRARDDFLSIASHELRTPLATLQIKLYTLHRRIREMSLPPETLSWSEHQFAVIDRQLRRLVRLIEDMLDISRLTSGQLRLEPEPFDLAALVREVVELFRETGEMARGRSEVRLTLPEEVMGRWDRLRLEQVTTNLLSNALKYGRGQPIDVEVRREGALARLVVRDRGIGIAPEDQERVFGRFERAVPVRHFGGFGLGLYISRQVVEAMHGAIQLESKPGEGSTFTVLLPLDDPAASHP